MKRALAAIAAGLVVATLAPIASDASGPAPAQAATSACISGDAPSVEVVLLVDQSKSLRGDLPQIQRAVEQVGNRLVVPVQDGLDVKFGVAKFGDSASTIRELSPVRIGESFTELGEQLSNGESLDQFTDYIQGLNQAIRMFDTGDRDACKVLLWFTDGMFDLGPLDLGASPNSEEEDEAEALTSAVCGNGRNIARLIGSRGITTFAVLLKEQPDEKWNDWYLDYPNLGAGLSSMQAITGDRVIDDLPIVGYAQSEPCAPFTAENTDLGGEVLVGGGALPGILSTRLGQALGNEPVSCPEDVAAGSVGTFPEGGMPPGVILADVFVTAVAGEIGSVAAVLPGGGPSQPLQRSSLDNRLDREALRALPGGWQLEISSAGERGLQVCIQYDEKVFPTADVTVAPSPATVVNGVGTQIELIVDWSPAFNEIDPAGVIESWTLSGGGLEVMSGTLFDPDSVAVVTVDERENVDAFELDAVVLVAALQGSDQEVVFQGRIEPPIVVRTLGDRPRLECTGSGDHGFGELTGDDKIGGLGVEVPRDTTFASPGICTVYPPKSVDPETNTGFVEVTFEGSAHPDPDIPLVDMPWKLQKQKEDGTWADEDEFPVRVNVADEPLVLRVATSTELVNKEYDGGGAFTLRTEWSRETTLDVSQAATFVFEVELIPRSRPWWALIITLIVTAIAMLVSLALLRLMNHLLVRIPEPGAFYFRVVPVKISPDPVLGASWSPTGDGFASESRPVGADSPGRDLKAGPLRVHRSLGPVWKPFSSPFSRLKGDRVIRSTPSGRRPGTAPVAFPSLTALMTSADERFSDGSFAGQIVVLYPRRHEFDEMQVRQDVDRLVGPVGEDVGRLAPDTSEVFDPKPSGARAPERSGSESASGGAGSVAPPSRSGPPSVPTRDTSTPDREPPRREPPRREPPPRGR